MAIIKCKMCGGDIEISGQDFWDVRILRQHDDSAEGRR